MKDSVDTNSNSVDIRFINDDKGDQYSTDDNYDSAGDSDHQMVANLVGLDEDWAAVVDFHSV